GPGGPAGRPAGEEGGGRPAGSALMCGSVREERRGGARGAGEWGGKSLTKKDPMLRWGILPRATGRKGLRTRGGGGGEGLLPPGRGVRSGRPARRAPLPRVIPTGASGCRSVVRRWARRGRWPEVVGKGRRGQDRFPGRKSSGEWSLAYFLHPHIGCPEGERRSR